MKKILLTFALVFTLFISMFWMASQQMKNAQKLPGSALNGIQAVLATTSTINIGPGTNKNMLFVENSVCTSRVISTGPNAIMLSFTRANLANTATTTANPGPTIGFQQLASTTVVYDSGVWGCPAVSAYGFVASTTATISEFQ